MKPEVEVIGEITDRESIAIGRSIQDLDRLQKKHGRGRWRKLKGFATVRLPDQEAEKHQLLRVSDESGEDYLFPASLFSPITLPQTLIRELTLST